MVGGAGEEVGDIGTRVVGSCVLEVTVGALEVTELLPEGSTLSEVLGVSVWDIVPVPVPVPVRVTLFV